MRRKAENKKITASIIVKTTNLALHIQHDPIRSASINELHEYSSACIEAYGVILISIHTVTFERATFIQDV